jgi:hypothetical protein
MPASFLSRHRTICAVLEEIKELALKRDDTKTVMLCDEAKLYAERMSVRLFEYKTAQEVGKYM